MTHTRLIVLILALLVFVEWLTAGGPMTMVLHPAFAVMALGAVSLVADHGLRKIGRLTDTSGVNL